MRLYPRKLPTIVFGNDFSEDDQHPSFFDIGNGFGPSLLGLVIPITGYPVMYAILGISVMATSFLYYLLHGKKEKNDRKHLLNKT